MKNQTLLKTKLNSINQISNRILRANVAFLNPQMRANVMRPYNCTQEQLNFFEDIENSEVSSANI
jgi:hypothetical protein